MKKETTNETNSETTPNLISILADREKGYFILNNEKYRVHPAGTTYKILDEVMGAVAKEILPEAVYEMYREMLFEVRLMKGILRGY